MANLYTYDELLKRINDAGMMGQFSDADLRLAQQNPDYGFQTLNNKLDYAKATTPEARALINANQESLRMSLGGFSGGVDGMGYNPVQQTKTQQLQNYPTYSFSGSRPDSSYVDNAYNALANYEPFSYDYNSDPLYGQYKQAYTREGQLAERNALGAAAAMTGGIPSSYATTAAAQAGNYYAAQLADKIPELYQLAYNQYADQYNRNLNTYNAAMSRYGTELSQFNTDRNFDYGVYGDNFNRLASVEGNDYQRQLDLAQLGAKYGDYSGLNALGIDTSAMTAKGGGGGGNPAPLVEPVSDALWQSLATLPAEQAAQALVEYYDRLTESQRNVLARRAGVDPQTVKRGIGNAADTAALLGIGGLLPQPEDNTVAEYATIADYQKAIEYMRKKGFTNYSDFLPQDEWNREKLGGVQNPSTNYPTYYQYIQAYLNYATA